MSSQFSARSSVAKGNKNSAHKMESILKPCLSLLEKTDLSSKGDGKCVKSCVKPLLPVERACNSLPGSDNSFLTFPVKMEINSISNEIEPISMTHLPTFEVCDPITSVMKSTSELSTSASQQNKLGHCPVEIKIESQPIVYGEDSVLKPPKMENNLFSCAEDSVLKSQFSIKSESDTNFGITESISLSRLPSGKDNLFSCAEDSVLKSQFSIKSESDTNVGITESISLFHLPSDKDNLFSCAEDSVLKSQFSIKSESDTNVRIKESISLGHLPSDKDNLFSCAEDSVLKSQFSIKSESDTNVGITESISLCHLPSDKDNSNLISCGTESSSNPLMPALVQNKIINNVVESVFQPCVSIKMESQPTVHSEKNAISSSFVSILKPNFPLKMETNLIFVGEESSLNHNFSLGEKTNLAGDCNELDSKPCLFVKEEIRPNFMFGESASKSLIPSEENTLVNSSGVESISNSHLIAWKGYDQKMTAFAESNELQEPPERQFVSTTTQEKVKKPIVCEICGKTFTKRYSLSRHSLIHAGVKNFACETCGMRFARKSNFVRHKLTHNALSETSKALPEKNEPQGHPPSQPISTLNSEEFEMLKCEICDMKFNLRSSLLHHALIHAGIKKFACDICGMQFTTKSYVEDHKLTQHASSENPKKTILSQINKPQSQTPSEPLSTHTSEEVKELFACETCDKKFTLRKNLYRHRLSHSNNKPFCCEICGMQFTRKSYVEHHRLTQHTSSENPKKTILSEINKPQSQILSEPLSTFPSEEVKALFACETCDKKFTFKTNLHRHMLSHSTTKPFCCEICGMQFTRKRYVEQHKLTHRLTSLDCDKCGQKNPKKTISSEISKPQSQTPSKPLSTYTSEEGKELFACETCDKKFTFKTNLHRHMLSHSTTKPFCCEICDMQFTRKSYVEHHKLTHRLSSLDCDKCGQHFTQKRQWINHSCDISETKPYICHVCSAAFKHLSSMTDHMQNHSERKLVAFQPNEISKEVNKPFACETCGMRFVIKSRLERHKLIHVTVKAFDCKDCGKLFTTKKNLQFHLRIHSGEKPYVCSVCQASFTYANAFRNHCRTHTGERPYHCNLCNGTFPTNTALRFHRLTHTQERAFSCDFCSRTFNRKTTLDVHVLSRHSKVKPFACDLCPKAFATKQILDIHFQSSHSDDRPFPCKLCGKCFKTKSAVYTHTKTHTDARPVTCDYCGKGFRNRHCLDNHIRTHTNERPFVCQICEYAFTQKTALDRHYRIHTGEKPFICDVCNQCFNQRSLLNSHRLKHFED